MQVVTSTQDMQRIADATRASDRRIGLVPTMGFLHEGHMSLVEAIRESCSLLALSIFVNPMQFGPSEDFTAYPRDIDRDLAMAEARGCDLVFLPSTDEMYPDGFQTSIDVRTLSLPLEGEFRPGHFRGVATIVAKLFNIVKPHVAVFGQKDAQQSILIRRMARDLNLDVDIVIAPIVREPDGLAMSSRNTYLSPDERAEALAISRSLHAAEALHAGGCRDALEISAAVMAELNRTGRIKVEYVRIVDADALVPIQAFDPRQAALVAVAARVGTTRLIDNTILNRTAMP
jgi:pantoate--beta-alanine ligase